MSHIRYFQIQQTSFKMWNSCARKSNTFIYETGTRTQVLWLEMEDIDIPTVNRYVPGQQGVKQPFKWKQQHTPRWLITSAAQTRITLEFIRPGESEGVTDRLHNHPSLLVQLHLARPRRVTPRHIRLGDRHCGKRSNIVFPWSQFIQIYYQIVIITSPVFFPSYIKFEEC